MKIMIFRADQGDCLLLGSSGGTHILVDGGTREAYKRQIGAALGLLAEAKTPIDLVCLSHIDDDHIGGIRQLMDDLAAWRVFDYQVSTGNNGFKKPEVPRPPEVFALWHNAFKDQVGDNSAEIESQLVANARVVNLNPRLIDASISHHAEEYGNLATGVKDALLLARRISPRQLKIPVNKPFKGWLVMVDRSDGLPGKVAVGDIGLTVIGPFKEDLRRLRTEWNRWLAKNKAAVREIRKQAKEDEALYPMNEGQLVLSSLLALAAELGKRGAVTLPNLASIMLLVEADGKTLLMTGDGHADDILKGLKRQRKLDGDGRIHLDVLKVQHHASEHNIHQAFCDAVSADHYIFCADGAHENPDLDAIQAILDSRLGAGEEGAQAGRPFKFWFSGSAETSLSEDRSDHMRKVEELIKKAAGKSKGRLRFKFLRQGARLQFTV